MIRRIVAAGALALGLISGSAVAADQPVKGPVYKAAPVFNWTGFYVGGHSGYAWGDALLNALSTEPEGWYGGAQLGYNWQARGSRWVLGIEADISGGNVDDLVAGNNTELRLFGTFRGRIGYAMDRSLIYFTGGAAWGDNKITAVGASDNQTHFGHAIGAGWEFAIAPRWSAKIEYLFIDLGTETYNVGGVVGTATVEFSTVRLGVNYRW